jgi:DNA-binding response OmpR family regulator
MARALLIEDDATIASLMSELLRGQGFEVDHVSRRDQAIAVALRHKPTVIVTDLLAGTNPRDAWENVEGLRDAIPGVPVLVVTGHARAPIEGARRGFAVLEKPFDLEEFEVAVNELLGR